MGWNPKSKPREQLVAHFGEAATNSQGQTTPLPGRPLLDRNRRPLIADRRAVVARVRRCQSFPSRGVNADRIHESDVAAPSRRVPHGVQRAFQSLRKFALKNDLVRQPLVMEARRVNRSFRVHPEPHPVDHAEQRRRNNRRPARRAGHKTQLAIA